jgi:hypothetical protein
MQLPLRQSCSTSNVFRAACLLAGFALVVRYSYSSLELRSTDHAEDFEALVAEFAQRETRGSSCKRVTVTTVCFAGNEAWRSICQDAFANHQAYTRAQGYGLRFFDDESLLKGRRPAWYKLPAVISVSRCPGVDLVFWMDADSLFMDLRRSLGFLMPRGSTSMSFSRDWENFGDTLAPCSVLNSGHFFLRTGGWGVQLFQKAWDLYPAPDPQDWFEQSALMYLLGGCRPECREDLCAGLSQRVECLKRRPVPHCETLQPMSQALHNPGCNWSLGVDVRAKGEMNAWVSDFVRGRDQMIQFAGQSDVMFKVWGMRIFSQRVQGFTPPPAPPSPPSQGCS